MSRAVISTMWMQHRFDHVLPFAREALALGFDAIEISHVVTPPMMEGLQPDGIAVASLHYPAPTVRHAGGARGDKLLASLDDDARLWAVGQGYRSIDCAQALGAKAVCVHLGQVDMDVQRCWVLEQRYLAGQASSAIYARLRDAILFERAERQAAHLAAARRSLNALARHADRVGVRLGLENRRHVFEIPTPDELQMLLAESDPLVVGFWYDTGHAQVLANLGFGAASEWLRVFADAIVGVHLHDAVGTRDHLIPGLGEVDFAAIAERIPSDAVRVCEFDWYFGAAEVQEGRDRLRESGCLVLPF